MISKGIVLAGGSGTRLHPVTLSTSKQLLPVYDKPMLYYPLSILMLTGIRDILVMATPQDLALDRQLLRDGHQWGISLSYSDQPRPGGLGQAFIIGRRFVGNDSVVLVLGDNIFYGHGLPEQLRLAAHRTVGATVFAYGVHDPERYGAVQLDEEGNALDIVEKPPRPKSHFGVTGLYFYNNQVLDIAASLQPSGRGELETTDVSRAYLKRGTLKVDTLGRGEHGSTRGRTSLFSRRRPSSRPWRLDKGSRSTVRRRLPIAVGISIPRSSSGRHSCPPRRAMGRIYGISHRVSCEVRVCAEFSSPVTRVLSARSFLSGGSAPDYRPRVFDALTYAGSLANLGPPKSRPAVRFVRGDICDGALVTFPHIH